MTQSWEGTDPPSSLTGDTAEAVARSVSRAIRPFARAILVLLGSPARARSGREGRLPACGVPRCQGRAGLQGLAVLLVGRCAKAKAGRLPRTFQCIHITIRSSRARASLPAARVGWERERERLGWSWGRGLVPPEPGSIGAEPVPG